MRHFELSEGTSSKFWEIEQDGSDLNIRWGRIGTAGQCQSKTFADATKATAALDKLIHEKTRKGYTEIQTDAGARLGKAESSPAAPAKLAAAAATDNSADNTHSIGDSLDAQIERVFEGVWVQIDQGIFNDVYGNNITSDKIQRRFQVKRPAAILAARRLVSCGLLQASYGNDTLWLTGGSRNIARQLRERPTTPPALTIQTPAVSIDANLPPWLARGVPVRLTPHMPITSVTLLQQYGINAVAALEKKAEQPRADEALAAISTPEAVMALLEKKAEQPRAGEALAAIGTPEAVMALAKVAHQSEEALACLTIAIERWPLAALVALARRIAAGSKDGQTHVPRLNHLLQTHAGEVECLRPWLEPGAQAVIDRQLAALSVETADPAELPEVLRTPPWLSKMKKRAAGSIELKPLALEPLEHWQPGAREAAINLYSYWIPEREATKNDIYQLLGSLGFYARDSKAGQAAIARRDAQGFIDAWRKEGGKYIDYRCIPLLPADIAVPFWNTVAAPHEITYSNTHTTSAAYVLAQLGLPALPGLIALVHARPLEHTRLARHFGAVELALPMANAFSRFKKLHDLGRGWLLAFPEHAACGLIAPALGKDKNARTHAAAALRLLHAHGHGDMVLEVAGRYHNPAVIEGVRAVLDESPLDRFPAKLAPLPEFWQPRRWRQPLLLNGKRLPDDALHHLGQMLTFPSYGELYAGITEVKTACEPDSLADFAWDCFNAWLEEGAPSKENWAMLALGTLGNDDTARKLTPLIRAWPGESLHARATTGLDVLERIGTDVALMLLNGIAQKLKFKALQGSAREKINAIAQMRDLTPDELEDRLAPDLGLDERGTLRLDFGPRAFVVGFDEALKPSVRELDADGQPGKRLSDLPKPKKTDDADLAKAATDRFKRLKKDARTIAAQQVMRLETAMCTRRRWTPEVFRQCLADHPLLRHLVQRLIWAVYDVQDERNTGDEVRAFFRVAEDGTYTTAGDDRFEIPGGKNIRIGIPHALELPEADAVAFGQLFADYELLQPFVQMGRDAYTLTEEEKSACLLTRWEGVSVPSGRVRGLVNRGWERGGFLDGGDVNEFHKPLASGGWIELRVTPGFAIGQDADFLDKEQQIDEIRLSTGGAFGTLDTIAASEFLRDLESLRAPVESAG